MPEKSVNVRLSIKDSETVKKALASLGREGQAALKKLEQGAQPASRGLRAVDEAARGLRGSVDGLASRLGTGGRVLAAFGPAGLAAAAGIGVLTLGFAAALRAAQRVTAELDALDDTANRLGVGVETLQELRFAARQSGIDIGALEMGLQRLSRRLGEVQQMGRGTAKDALEALGISVRDATGRFRAMDDVLPEIFDKLAAVEDQTRRNALAQKLFDSEGVQFVQWIEQGTNRLAALRRQAREMGVVIDEAMVKRASEANDKLALMSDILGAKLKTALVELIPVLDKGADLLIVLAQGLSSILQDFTAIPERSTAKLRQDLAEVSAAIEVLVEEGRGWLQSEEDFNARLERLYQRRRTIIDELMRRDRTEPAPDRGIMGVPPQIQAVIDKLEEEAAALQRTATEQAIYTALKEAGVDATDEYAGAIERLVRRIEGLKAAKKEYDRAQAEGIVVTEAVRTEEEKYAAEVERLKKLLDAAAISQDTFNRAVGNLDADRARRELEEATDFMSGLRRGLQQVHEEASDVASQVEDMVVDAFQGMEDALVDFVTTGKADFKSLVDSIIADLARLAIRQAITAPLSGALGSVFGGSFHTGGTVGETAAPTRTVSPAVFLGAPRLHNGLAPDEFPAILQRGETVLPRGQRGGQANVTITFAPVIDARGAEAGAERRIAQVLEEQRKAFRREVPGLVRDAQSRGGLF